MSEDKSLEENFETANARITPGVTIGGMGEVSLPNAENGNIGSGDVPDVADIDDDEEEAKKDKTKKKLEMEGFKLFTQFNNFITESLSEGASNFKVLLKTAKEESIGRKVRLGDKKDPGNETWEKIDATHWMNLKTEEKLDLNKWAKHADNFNMEGKDLQFENFVTEAKIPNFKFGQKTQYSFDDINDQYGFWGTLEVNMDPESIEEIWHDVWGILTKSWKFSDAGALSYLNAKAGRWLADKVWNDINSQISQPDAIDMILSDYARPSKWKAWAKEYNEHAQEELAESDKIYEEAVLENAVRDLHFEIDADKAEDMKIAIGASQGEVSRRKQIEGGEYSLRRFRKEIKYDETGEDLGVFKPGSYMAATSKLGDGPHKKAAKKVRWNQKMYDQWIEDVASNGGWQHAFDMAQNAKHERGLIDWVKKNYRDDDPMQRIQWDIEAFAESVTKKPFAEWCKLNEAKSINRDEMMEWIKKHMDFVGTTEEFSGSQGGIHVSGEDGDEFKGNVIYNYYSEDYKNREFGVWNKWEKELNKRGWYSEWYDAGTVCIWPL